MSRGDFRYTPQPRPSRADPRVLLLSEIAILRRLAAREKPGAIAMALGVHRTTVTCARARMRKTFGVNSDEELLAHPDVHRQLEK